MGRRLNVKQFLKRYVDILIVIIILIVLLIVLYYFDVLDVIPYFREPYAGPEVAPPSLVYEDVAVIDGSCCCNFLDLNT